MYQEGKPIITQMPLFKGKDITLLCTLGHIVLFIFYLLKWSFKNFPEQKQPNQTLTNKKSQRCVCFFKFKIIMTRICINMNIACILRLVCAGYA